VDRGIFLFLFLILILSALRKTMRKKEEDFGRQSENT
jgi:hypothetical protein